jgi:RNA-binding protein NOB1
MSEGNPKFNAVVVDSGFIIRKTGLSHLAPASATFYIPPEVRAEIRDVAAREHLASLPFQLIDRAPSKEAMVAVSAFARLTGDFRALSVVDLKVLALAYDVEKEGVGSVAHLRTQPVPQNLKEGKKKKKGKNRRGKKKPKGGAAGETVGEADKAAGEADASEGPVAGAEQPPQQQQQQQDDDALDDDRFEYATESESDSEPEVAAAPAPKSWAMTVNPKANPMPAADPAAKKQLFVAAPAALEAPESSGQFSDAESSDDDEGTYAGSDADISDEECDIYVLDEDEVDARYKPNNEPAKLTVEEELMSDFPSLSAAATVEYVSDNEEQEEQEPYNAQDHEEEERKKKEALTPKPVVKDGKLYNSFKKYGDLMSQEPVLIKPVVKANVADYVSKMPIDREEYDGASRIINGHAGQTDISALDDDGEGWVGGDGWKKSKDVDPFLRLTDAEMAKPQVAPDGGPAMELRCACATTDFAMQNVLLQMGMKLLSVDGEEVTRTKSWVTRCGACFAVYGGDQSGTKLFCGRCGSDALQRVAASIDAETGKQRLHLSAKRKNDIRGTKFSLPKPGKQNRFAGDLLLREDQLLMGAWNMKVKKGKGQVESMFGADIIDNVGLGDLSKRDDIKVGFGRPNVNAAKSGRERRGKAKKNDEVKACGMRRAWS